MATKPMTIADFAPQLAAQRAAVHAAIAAGCAPFAQTPNHAAARKAAVVANAARVAEMRTFARKAKALLAKADEAKAKDAARVATRVAARKAVLVGRINAALSANTTTTVRPTKAPMVTGIVATSATCVGIHRITVSAVVRGIATMFVVKLNRRRKVSAQASRVVVEVQAGEAEAHVAAGEVNRTAVRFSSEFYLGKGEWTAAGTRWLVAMADAALTAAVNRVVETPIHAFVEKGGVWGLEVVEHGWARPRPVGDALRAIFVKNPGLDAGVIEEAARKAGYTPVGAAKKQIMLLPSAEAAKYLPRLGATAFAAADQSFWTRGPVPARRQGAVSVRFTLPHTSLPVGKDGKELYDGTLAVTSEVMDAFQGTMIQQLPRQTRDGMDWILTTQKGIVRPPLCFSTGAKEQEGSYKSASFGRTFQTGDSVEVVIGSLVNNQGYALDPQSLAFSAVNAAEMLEQRADELATCETIDLLDRASQAWHAVGAPITALGRGLSAQQLRAVTPDQGARLLLIASTEVRVGDVVLSVAARRQAFPGLQEGATVLVSRDPALPHGGSVNALRFGGVAWFETNTEALFVVMNPNDPAVAAMGADFDGDRVRVIRDRRMVLHSDAASVIEEAQTLRANVRMGKVPTPTRSSAGVVGLDRPRALQNFISRAENVGSIVNQLLMLWEMGSLEEMRAVGSAAIDGDIDAQKHPVNEVVLGRLVRHVAAAFDALGEESLPERPDRHSSQEELDAWFELQKQHRAAIREASVTGVWSAYKKALRAARIEGGTDVAGKLASIRLEAIETLDAIGEELRTREQAALAEVSRWALHHEFVVSGEAGHALPIAIRKAAEISVRANYTDADSQLETAKALSLDVSRAARAVAMAARDADGELVDPTVGHAYQAAVAALEWALLAATAEGGVDPLAFIAMASPAALKVAVRVLRPAVITDLGFAITRTRALFSADPLRLERPVSVSYEDAILKALIAGQSEAEAALRAGAAVQDVIQVGNTWEATLTVATPRALVVDTDADEVAI